MCHHSSITTHHWSVFIPFFPYWMAFLEPMCHHSCNYHLLIIGHLLSIITFVALNALIRADVLSLLHHSPSLRHSQLLRGLPSSWIFIYFLTFKYILILWDRPENWFLLDGLKNKGCGVCLRDIWAILFCVFLEEIL